MWKREMGDYRKWQGKTTMMTRDARARENYNTVKDK